MIISKVSSLRIKAAILLTEKEPQEKQVLSWFVYGEALWNVFLLTWDFEKSLEEKERKEKLGDWH